MFICVCIGFSPGLGQSLSSAALPSSAASASQRATLAQTKILQPSVPTYTSSSTSNGPRIPNRRLFFQGRSRVRRHALTQTDSNSARHTTVGAETAISNEPAATMSETSPGPIKWKVKPWHLRSDVVFPQDPEALTLQMDKLCEVAGKHFGPAHQVADGRLKAIIVPHSTYSKSGLCAASVYKLLQDEILRTSGSNPFGAAANSNSNTDSKSNSNSSNSNPEDGSPSGSSSPAPPRPIRVVLLGPSHFEPFRGMALPNFDAYRIPTGTIPLDTASIDLLQDSSLLFSRFGKAFTKEHSVELQLPFLHHVLQDRLWLVPLLVGDIRSEDLDRISSCLLPFIFDPHSIFVISSDFTHYGKRHQFLPFRHQKADNIRYLDAQAINALLRVSRQDFEEMLERTKATICGENAIRILLRTFEMAANPPSRTSMSRLSQLDWEPPSGSPPIFSASLMNYYTTEQFANAKSHASGNYSDLGLSPSDDQITESVSFASLAFYMEDLFQEPMFEDEPFRLSGFEKNELLSLARRTIASRLLKNTKPKNLPPPIDPDIITWWHTKDSNLTRAALETQTHLDDLPEHLVEPLQTNGLCQVAGLYVILRKRGEGKELRGCVGTPVGREPLWQLVSQIARAAAYDDPRYKPVASIEELNEVTIQLVVIPELMRLTPEQIEGGGSPTQGIAALRKTRSGYDYGVFLPDDSTGAVADDWTTARKVSKACEWAGAPSNDPSLELFGFEPIILCEA